ncbi:MAG: hypothetical protein AAB389_02115 [Patescibacteria group bacterium]
MGIGKQITVEVDYDVSTVQAMKDFQTTGGFVDPHVFQYFGYDPPRPVGRLNKWLAKIFPFFYDFRTGKKAVSFELLDLGEVDSASARSQILKSGLRLPCLKESLFYVAKKTEDTEFGLPILGAATEVYDPMLEMHIWRSAYREITPTFGTVFNHNQKGLTVTPTDRLSRGCWSSQCRFLAVREQTI